MDESHNAQTLEVVIMRILDELRTVDIIVYKCECCGKWKYWTLRDEPITKKEQERLDTVFAMIDELCEKHARELRSRVDTSGMSHSYFFADLHRVKGKELRERINKVKREVSPYKLSKKVITDVLNSLVNPENLMIDELVRRVQIGNAFAFKEILESFPVIRTAPELEPLISDTDVTKNSFKDFKMPYPALFLDKIFEVGNNLILGIAVYDALEVSSYLKKNVSQDEVLEDLSEDVRNGFLELERENGNNYDRLIISFIVIEIDYDKGNFGQARFVTQTFTKILETKSTEQPEIRLLLKEALDFVLNTCLLITNHINLKFPASHNSDFRLIPYYPNAKAKRAKSNRFSVLKVFGETKRDVDEYNRERRKYDKHSLEAVIVRGHWRHLESKRYKAKRGQAIWIPPFFKGKDRELYSRIVKVEP